MENEWKSDAISRGKGATIESHFLTSVFVPVRTRLVSLIPRDAGSDDSGKTSGGGTKARRVPKLVTKQTAPPRSFIFLARRSLISRELSTFGADFVPGTTAKIKRSARDIDEYASSGPP